MRPDELVTAGLGLPQGVVRLSIATQAWGVLAERLADDLRTMLGHDLAAVEHIGSTAVPGLLCKPIIDLAVRLRIGADDAQVVAHLTDHGWHFAGDQGAKGGLMFSLRDTAGRRLVHLHVVGPVDPQWGDYLQVREALRSDATARSEYVAVKTALAAAHPFDRVAYTDGKDEIIARLRCP